MECLSLWRNFHIWWGIIPNDLDCQGSGTWWFGMKTKQDDWEGCREWGYEDLPSFQLAVSQVCIREHPGAYFLSAQVIQLEPSVQDWKKW